MDRRRLRWLNFWIVVALVLSIALGPSFVNLPRVWLECRIWNTPNAAEPTQADAETRQVTDAISDYQREEDKTYLTLPEWYIVYSTDEYAAFIAEHSSSDFPYFRAVGQYWKSYRDVCGVIRGRYPLNVGQHFTDAFIGISFTAENMLKGAYEGTVGRVSDWLSSDNPTEEEVYAARVAQEYGAFMHETPWYFFPFGETLRGLWSETNLWGPDPVRKWERKLALTVEYGGKALFSGFTNLGAQATYGGADVSKIYAVAEGVTPEMTSENLEIKQSIDASRQLIYVTRFEYLSVNAPVWMEQGMRFVEIAGNDEILFTVLGQQDADYTFDFGEYLFDLPILTHPGQTRVAVKVRVAEMHLFLEELRARPDVQFEHFYDY